METKQNVIINERTLKGYIELHKVYNEPLSDTMGSVILKKIFPVYGIGGLVAAGLALTTAESKVLKLSASLTAI